MKFPSDSGFALILHNDSLDIASFQRDESYPEHSVYFDISVSNEEFYVDRYDARADVYYRQSSSGDAIYDAIMVLGIVGDASENPAAQITVPELEDREANVRGIMEAMRPLFEKFCADEISFEELALPKAMITSYPFLHNTYIETGSLAEARRYVIENWIADNLG